jgi:hypothetical protein
VGNRQPHKEARMENEKQGFIQCGICRVPVVIGNKIKLMFCPNVECVNSEENY